jgi:hypothetical protein
VFAIPERANFYRQHLTVGAVLRRMRCADGRGDRVAAT